ncbi:MAG TPA: amidohydrolase family protein [Chloroflexota bacterium]|nr:amidohydrolase family protein [Chloroflexota bacterium]
MIIDAHIHIFPPEIVAERERFFPLDPHFAELYKNPRARLVTAEEALASLDRNGVAGAFALGFGWRDPALCRWHNDYLIDVQNRFPGRFAGFGIIQPRETDAALAEVERIAAAGLRGVGELMPHGQGYRLDDFEVMGPVVEALIARRLPLVVHVSEPLGHPYPGKGEVTPTSAWQLASRYPDLKVVFAHWGGGLPFYELMPEVSVHLKGVYYDSAATTYLYHFDVFRLVAELCGADRVLFATDYPLLRQGPFLQKVRALGLPEPALDLILGQNAIRLIGAEGKWPATGLG